MDIGAKIKSYLKSKSMMQSDLCRKIGLSTAFISEVSNGHKIPNIHTLGLICDALNITMSDFFKSYDQEENFRPMVDICAQRLHSLSDQQLKLIDEIISQFTQNDFTNMKESV